MPNGNEKRQSGTVIETATKSGKSAVAESVKAEGRKNSEPQNRGSELRYSEMDRQSISALKKVGNGERWALTPLYHFRFSELDSPYIIQSEIRSGDPWLLTFWNDKNRS